MFAEELAWIVDKRGQLVKLKPKPAQLKLDAALEAQREAGLPMRVLVGKARQWGGCLVPDTRVLTADLRWVRIGHLEPGAELVAVDEQVPGGKGRGRKMRRTVVEATRRLRKPVFQITMSNGETLVASGDHRFLCRRRRGPEMQWRTVQDMEVGDCIRSVTRPWGGSDYEDGWMGGFIDGEGCLRKKPRAGTELNVAQRLGPTWDRALHYLRSRGYTFREELDSREAGSSSKFSKHPIARAIVGRTNELFRLVGQTRPTRFVDRDWWEDKDLPGRGDGTAVARIESIEPLGERVVVDLQTSTKTFIAEGFVSHNSTWTECKITQRTILRSRHRSLIVAHDGDTAGNLFRIAQTIYANLPDEEEWLKPRIANQRKERLMYFANPSRIARNQGDVGLDSFILAAPAGEYEAGRGQTFHSFHGSECAFWSDLKRKLTSLMQTVPDEPETMIVLESTSNGFNHWKTLCDAALAGENEFALVFVAWWEEAGYQRPFIDGEEREAFAAEVGEGEYGEDEPALLDLGLSLEQLNWRRWAIVNKCQGDLRVFQQEYPATLEESFLTTGKRVFAGAIVDKIVRELEDTSPLSTGVFEVAESVKRKVPGGVADVPLAARWVEKRAGQWSVYEWPQREMSIEDAAREFAEGRVSVTDFERLTRAQRDGKVPEGQYIVSVDPAGGAETDDGESAWHAIDVGDHRTRMQCAVYQSRHDPDEVAVQAYLAALHWNRAWVVIETTGGYGTSMAKLIWRTFRYPWIYTRRSQESKSERQEDRLGWSTNVATKPLIEDGLKQVLREGTHGIRDLRCARQFQTYVKNERGKTGPESGKFADALMARGIFHQVAQEKPLRPVEKKRPATRVDRGPVNPITRY